MTSIQNASFLNLIGGKALLPDGWSSATVRCSGNRIAEPQGCSGTEGLSLDVSGCLILPGLVDLHGDAFERAITPRPGVSFDISLGVAANDGDLIGNGITTFYYAITDGFEPGPRSRDAARETMAFIRSTAERLRCRGLLHLRHELANTEGHDELLEWIANGDIDLLSLNDHLPKPGNETSIDRYRKGITKRLPWDKERIDAFVEELQARRPLGVQQADELAVACRRAGLALASHDDATMEDIGRSADRQVAICEFPTGIEIARAAREHGQTVVMGAPNLVRGKSHVGWLSVREAVQAGVVDALVSDYHYPALFQAPFVLDRLDILPLAEAWNLVSRNPAKAAGLDDRGSIEAGQLADLVIVKEGCQDNLDLVATIVDGRIVNLRDHNLLSTEPALTTGA